MLRSIVAVLLLAVGVTAQSFPNVQVRQLTPSCGGSTGYPFVARRSDLYEVRFRLRDVAVSSGLLVIGLTPTNFPLPLLPHFAPGCVAGVQPLVTVNADVLAAQTIGILPPPWGGSNPGFSPFALGVPLYVQGIGNCGEPAWDTIWCLTEAWSVTYWR